MKSQLLLTFALLTLGSLALGCGDGSCCRQRKCCEPKCERTEKCCTCRHNRCCHSCNMCHRCHKPCECAKVEKAEKSAPMPAKVEMMEEEVEME